MYADNTGHFILVRHFSELTGFCRDAEHATQNRNDITSHLRLSAIRRTAIIMPSKGTRHPLLFTLCCCVDAACIVNDTKKTCLCTFGLSHVFAC